MKVNSGAKKIKKISLYMYMYLSKKRGKLLRKTCLSLFIAYGRSVADALNWLDTHHWVAILQPMSATFEAVCPKIYDFLDLLAETLSAGYLSHLYFVLRPIISQNILFSIHRIFANS